MINWFLLGITYIFGWLSMYIHEFFHFGTKFYVKFFPPSGYTENVSNIFLPSCVHLIIASVIFYYKPENIFIYLFGFVNFFIWIYQSIFGTIKKTHLWNETLYDLYATGHGTFWLVSGLISVLIFFDYYIIKYLALINT